MKVLIAVDDSPCSSSAIDSVANRCWAPTTEFCVISVVEPTTMHYGFAGTYVFDSMAEAEHQYADYCRKLVDDKTVQLSSAFGKDKVIGKVVEGNIAESIIDEAMQWKADLIVVGSHGRRGFQRFLLGSVAEKVAGHAPCSVEIVKDKKIVHEHAELQKTQSKMVSKVK